MVKYNITNNYGGVRGHGDIRVEAKSTLEGVELSDEMAAEIEAFGVLELESLDADKPRRGRPPKQPADDVPPEVPAVDPNAPSADTINVQD
jgi:hypothetical protein